MADPSSSSTAMTSPNQIRPEMVSSAISFLSDPKVQSSSLSQRVSFLESKGLRPQEIDEALRSAGQVMAGSGGALSASHPPYPYGHGAPPPAYYNPNYPAQPSQQGRDWRDWFIMAVVSGTIGYGVISLAKKYLMPHLQPPNANVLEADLEALTSKYDEVAAQLATLDAQTLAVKQGLDEQKEEVEKGIREVEECVKAVRENEKKRDEEMDGIKREVESIRKELNSMFEKTKQAQTNSLSDLQAELKSLKSLLVSRGSMGTGIGGVGGGAATAASTSGVGSTIGGGRPFGPNVNGNAFAGSFGSTSSPSFGPTSGESTPPTILPKPSIPAWQLAGGSSISSSNSSPAIVSSGSNFVNSTTSNTTATSSDASGNLKNASVESDSANASGSEASEPSGSEKIVSV
ncbi:hypothetical protein IE53DRAFT_327206 [Violaceomyces palustris]|uniref:Uncharacterized protein n=1 Tax=Violaceomyces palustris TaxID=1673888 RepID=A0ACD0P2K6_9BASI|nr:hypothetical protein IE53DRAFT_327206 [Violaceomyces palustris]